jgi:hypothetical protein
VHTFCFLFSSTLNTKSQKSVCALSKHRDSRARYYGSQVPRAQPTTGSEAPACPWTPVAQRKMSCAPVVALASAVSSTTTRSCAAPASSSNSRRRSRSSSRGPTDGPRGPRGLQHLPLPGPSNSLRQISTRKVNKVSTD